MKPLYITVLGVMVCGFAAAQGQETPQPLKLVQKIARPGVQGRIDHMSVDHTISGLAEPQAVLYVPESNLIFVADGEQDCCKVYDGTSYEPIHTEPSLNIAVSKGANRRVS